jgi:hypothetical protein
MDIAHKRATVDADTIALGRSVRSVQRRIVAGGGTLALLVVGAFALVADHWIRQTASRSTACATPKRRSCSVPP